MFLHLKIILTVTLLIDSLDHKVRRIPEKRQTFVIWFTISTYLVNKRRLDKILNTKTCVICGWRLAQENGELYALLA